MIQKHGEEEAIKRMMGMISGAGKVGGRSSVGGSRPIGGRMLGGKQTSRAEMDKYLLQY